MSKIVIVGDLMDETFSKRQKHCRKVLSPAGICVCVNAGCGMGGGGITPKILLYEDGRNDMPEQQG